MNKSANLHFTIGLAIRIFASLIVAISLPFLTINPLSPTWQVVFAFGSFLFVIGANVK